MLVKMTLNCFQTALLRLVDLFNLSIRRVSNCACALVLCLLVSSAFSQDVSDKRLLLLYSYHATFPTASQVYEGVFGAFGDDTPVIEIEYMDSKRLFDEPSQALFLQQFQYKLENRRPYDAVITADDNALRFALTHHESLLQNSPIFFIGVNDRLFALAQNDNSQVTGVIEATSMVETIQLAQTIRPDMTQLYVLSDSTVSGKSDLSEFLTLQSQFPELPFAVIDLATLSWQELSESLATLNANDALILLSAYEDRLGQRVSFDEGLATITTQAPLPILHLWEHGMGDGVLGGIIISHSYQAMKAVDMVKRYWQGEAIASMPVLYEQVNVPIFDVREMQRFGISSNSLPDNADIRFQTPSFWQRYGNVILVSMVVISALLSVISYLVWQNRSRHRLVMIIAARERTLQAIMDNLDAPVYLKDTQGRYLFVNEAARSVFGAPVHDIIGKTDHAFFDEATAEAIDKSDEQVFEIGQPIKLEEPTRFNDGDEIHYFQTTKLPLRNENDEIYALCGLSIDVTQRKTYEMQMERLAHIDSLTGLPNRLVVIDRLSQIIERNRRQPINISVLYMDLDGFKKVNDTYGHEVGDILLRRISVRMRGALRSSDTLARLSGDEFVALLLHEHDNDDEFVLLNRLIDEARRPVDIEKLSLTVTISIGVTRYPQNNSVLNADQLIRQADQAMYIAKTKGRNQAHYFDEGIEQQAVKRERLIHEVERAIEDEAFELHYQPKVDLKQGKVIGLEALIRWQHPERGLIMPGEFLPDIQNSAVMMQLDLWVMRQALTQMSAWHARGLSVPVSINMSRLQGLKGHLTELLNSDDADVLTPFLPLLEIEILESESINDLSNARDTIIQAQEHGLTFSLDDFGTGFSSLTYLRGLPVSTLKVDRTFVMEVESSQRDQAILAGIQDFGRAFNMNVVLEGTETQEQCNMLLGMGFSVFQGYYIARPMPAQAVPVWVSRWSAQFSKSFERAAE
jgi:diguanylate cyclase (GGDEF)-like protein/PAS domain S-box-containing protein